MPYEWTEPELFMVLDDAELGKDVIYHSYDNGDAGDRNQYHYQTDSAEDEEFEFDVRDLDQFDEDKTHEEVIKAAAAAGAIKFP